MKTVNGSSFKRAKPKKHRAVAFETPNAEIATISKKGAVKARAKGTCYLYAYPQNGA